MKDRSVHQARVKRFHNRSKAASGEESDDVFQWLEQYEVSKAEDESPDKNGLDLLEKFPNREHITKGYAHEEKKWEMLWDGTERVGMVARQAEGTMDPEISVGLGDKSPFDNQQLIEQTILDLTQNDNLLLKRCQGCNQAQDVQHSCQGWFERIAKKEFAPDKKQNEMRYPMFREVVQDIEDAEKTEETKCSMCQKSIWIPKEYRKCREGVRPEGHTDVETGEAISAATCPMHPLDEDKGDAIRMAFNMSYPVIIQEGEMRPRIYTGKTSLPPKKKGHLWQQVEKFIDPKEELEGSSAETSDKEEEIEHTVKEKKETDDQIYEAKSIIDYDEWDDKYKIT
jgi:hypothetical protein